MVQGVALELLCRLLFTEGSNPLFPYSSPNSPMLLTAMHQIKMYTPTVRPFFDIDSVFLIQIFCGTKNTGQNGQGMKIPTDL